VKRSDRVYVAPEYVLAREASHQFWPRQEGAHICPNGAWVTTHRRGSRRSDSQWVHVRKLEGLSDGAVGNMPGVHIKSVS
jgi:hypothetical protein